MLIYSDEKIMLFCLHVLCRNLSGGYLSKQTKINKYGKGVWREEHINSFFLGFNRVKMVSFSPPSFSFTFFLKILSPSSNALSS